MTAIHHEDLTIDKFMYLYTDTILMLYDDLRDLNSPFFLSYLNSGDINSFILDLLFFDGNFSTVTTNTKHHTSYNFELFTKMYRSEILDSLGVMKNFLRDFDDKHQLKLTDWCYFCFLYTDLSEMGVSNSK